MSIENKRDRFKDAEWTSESGKTCIIGGCGGTGSWLAILLNRIGMQTVIYDADIIESHNIGGQFYGKSNIGKTKVESIEKWIAEFCDEDPIIFCEKVTSETMSDKFVFSCFDNMQARKDLFESWVTSNKDNKDAIYIDLRLILEQCSIFCVTIEDIDKYRKYLFDDSEVADAPCTARQTSHAAALIASHAVSFFVNHLTNIKSKSKKRKVPFFWELFMPLDNVSYEPENMDEDDNAEEEEEIVLREDEDAMIKQNDEIQNVPHLDDEYLRDILGL